MSDSVTLARTIDLSNRICGTCRRQCSSSGDDTPPADGPMRKTARHRTGPTLPRATTADPESSATVDRQATMYALGIADTQVRRALIAMGRPASRAGNAVMPASGRRRAEHGVPTKQMTREKKHGREKNGQRTG